MARRIPDWRNLVPNDPELQRMRDPDRQLARIRRHIIEAGVDVAFKLLNLGGAASWIASGAAASYTYRSTQHDINKELGDMIPFQHRRLDVDDDEPPVASMHHIPPPDTNQVSPDSSYYGPDLSVPHDTFVPWYESLEHTPLKPRPGLHTPPPSGKFMSRFPPQFKVTLRSGCSLPSYAFHNVAAGIYNTYVAIALDRIYDMVYTPYWVGAGSALFPISWAIDAPQWHTIYKKVHVRGYRVKLQLSHSVYDTNSTVAFCAYAPQGTDDNYLSTPTSWITTPCVVDWMGQPDSRSWIQTQNAAQPVDQSRTWYWDYTDCAKKIGEMANDNRLDSDYTGQPVFPADPRYYRILFTGFSTTNVILPPMTIEIEQDVTFYDPFGLTN